MTKKCLLPFLMLFLHIAVMNSVMIQKFCDQYFTFHGTGNPPLLHHTAKQQIWKQSGTGSSCYSKGKGNPSACKKQHQDSQTARQEKESLC